MSWSLISLWRVIVKPPLGHERACSIEKLVPQAQVEGVGGQLYRRARAS